MREHETDTGVQGEEPAGMDSAGLGDSSVADLIALMVLATVVFRAVCRQTQIHPRTLT